MGVGIERHLNARMTQTLGYYLDEYPISQELSGVCVAKIVKPTIGVHRNTLRDWRKKDPLFELQCEAMQARDVNECLATIKERGRG